LAARQGASPRSRQLMAQTCRLLSGIGGPTDGQRTWPRGPFITLFTGFIMACPGGLRAQQPKKIARIGYLTTSSLESPGARVLREAFWQGLRELGYVEGMNILVEYRGADGKIERFPDVASELVRLEVDLIVAPNTPAARALKQATTTIPIVVPVMGDPVGDALVASLGRPGGNITGQPFLARNCSPSVWPCSRKRSPPFPG
jgi:putative ABC transport system substrate-binding protein